MRYTIIDQRVNDVAERQHGAFTRMQAYDAGASERFVARRLADGTWARPAPATFVLARSPGTWHRQVKVCELSVTGSAVAGLAAAALHELPGFRPGRPELWVPATANSRHKLATIHRYAGARHVAVAGIRVTTIPQTIADITGRVSPWILERTIDDALLEHRMTVPDLAERVEFYDGSRRPHLKLLRDLTAERGVAGYVPPDSELEALLWAGVLAAVPAEWVRQAPAPWRDRGSCRVDAMAPANKLIIEADGRRWHARIADFDRDRWRDNLAAAHGYRVLRFTHLHLTTMVEEVRAVVASALTEQAATAA